MEVVSRHPGIFHDHGLLMSIDVHYYSHGRIGDFVVKDPFVLGHESVGIIKAVGSDVPTRFQVGQKVAIEPGNPCRRCSYCKDGRYNLCRSMKFPATPPYDGFFAKYVAIDHDFVHVLPETISMRGGALVEPLSVAVRLAKQARIKPGATVIIFGAGPIGLLSAAVARAWGALSITIVDVQDSRLKFAKTKGWTDFVVNTMEVKPGSTDQAAIGKAVALHIKQTAGLTSNDGADCVMEATGAEPCIIAGIFCTRPGGTYAQAGLGRPVVAFPMIEALCREIEIRMAFRYTEGCFREAVHLLACGKVVVEDLVTHVFDWESAENAFKLVERGDERLVKSLIKGCIDESLRHDDL